MGFNIKSFAKDVLKMSFSMAGVGSGIGKGTVADRLEPTDVEIMAIDIVTGPGGETVQSLAGIVKEINIYESILSPAVFCELFVYDTTDIVNKAKLTEYTNSYIKIAFKSPNVNKPSEYTFIVEDVKGLENKNAALGAVYSLRCIPPELYTSNKQLVEAQTAGIETASAGLGWRGAYEGLPHEAIPTIINDIIGSTKKVHIRKKSDISINEIFPPRSAFALIDELRQLCVTHDYISSCFVFYEDCDGYHLDTIENMIQAQKTIFGSNASDKIFFFDAKRNRSTEGSNYRSILGYKEISTGSILNDAVNVDARYFDVKTGTITKEDGKPEVSIYMDEDAKSLRSIESLKSKDAAIGQKLLIVTSTDKDGVNTRDARSAQVMINRQKFLSDLLKNMKHIYVYGDNSIRVGNLISTNFIVPTDITGDGSGKIVRISGQYMVGKIRHIILNDDRPKYVMALEIFKSGIQED